MKRRSKEEIFELQKRVGAAIRAELPPDWTYFCSVCDPEGRHYILAGMRLADLDEWLARLPKSMRKHALVEQ